MYDQYRSQVLSAIERLGREADVQAFTDEGTTDEFGNPDESYTADGSVTCFRTYPNRNTEVQKPIGDRERDNPVFLFHPEEAPGEEDRLVYPEDAATVANATSTTTFKMMAPTVYDTHVEMFGEKVHN